MYGTTPAQAGAHYAVAREAELWVPAFAGMGVLWVPAQALPYDEESSNLVQ
jgi:hypothetical protein